MKLPDDYIEILGFSSPTDLIENLYLKSFIDAYYKVLKIKNIHNFNENKIRNEFQKILCYSSGLLSDLLNNNLIILGLENQIIKQNGKLRRTDIELIIPCLKYVVECKRLKGTNKKQYIDDGISRFINNKYIGINEKYAGMCSFVIKGNIEKIIIGTKDRISKYYNILIDKKKIVIINFHLAQLILK